MKLNEEYLFVGFITLLFAFVAAVVVAQVVTAFGVWALAVVPALWTVNAVGRIVVWVLDRNRKPAVYPPGRPRY